MDIQKEIINTIELMVSRMVEKMNLSTDVSSVVLDIDTVPTNRSRKTYISKYKVNIGGSEYWVYDGLNLNPQIGQHVWIHIPSNKYEDAYICALNRKEG